MISHYLPIHVQTIKKNKKKDVKLNNYFPAVRRPNGLIVYEEWRILLIVILKMFQILYSEYFVPSEETTPKDG